MYVGLFYLGDGGGFEEVDTPISYVYHTSHAVFGAPAAAAAAAAAAAVVVVCCCRTGGLPAFCF